MRTSVKVTISLPGDLADYADSLAGEAQKPCSQIIADLLAERGAAQKFIENLAADATTMAEADQAIRVGLDLSSR